MSTSQSTPLTPENLESLAQTVQPLIFETGLEEYPYSIKGTVFLVRYQQRPYVVTANHALRPEDTAPICVLPSDTSREIIPLGRVFFVPRSLNSDDSVDVAVIDINLETVLHPDVAMARLVDLEKACGDWESIRPDASFFILGFPAEVQEVKYETGELGTLRVMLNGRYAGRSFGESIHSMKVDDTCGLKSFDGFSGSPVFATVRGESQAAGGSVAPIFCGMVLRGTPQSKTVHFLDRDVILAALEIKRDRDLAEVAAAPR